MFLQLEVTGLRSGLRDLKVVAMLQEPAILIVEDDNRLCASLHKSLRSANYRPTEVRTLGEAWEALQRESYGLVLLDWVLPDGEGPQLLKRMRKKGLRVPVLLLTARDEVDDRVAGLDAGADDYLTKPFALAELLARIRTLLRRKVEVNRHLLQWGNLCLDVLNRRVSVNDEELILTPREFDLLSYLGRHGGEIVSRETLVREVWQAEGRFTSLDNVIDVHMANLRKKIRSICGSDPITTLRGVGYRMEAADYTSGGSISEKSNP